MNRIEADRQRSLPDGVVARRLGLRLADCPRELIALKRTHMLLCRALGTQLKSL